MPVASGTRVLVVLMGSLGDLVRGLSIVPALRQALPGLHLTWLVEATYAPLLAYYDGIDEVVVFQRRHGLRAFWETRTWLRKRTFDVTLDLQRILKSGVLSWASGAPRRIGFHRSESKEGNWLFQTESIPSSPREVPKIEQYHQFVSQLTHNVSGAFRWTWRDLGSAEVATRLLGKPSGQIVGMILGSRWGSKDWLPEGYQRLLQQLIHRADLTPVLFGDRAALELASALQQQCATPVVNLVGKTSLVELAALLRLCRVTVGPDSGPGHLAASFGVPQVTLMGPTSPVRVAPSGSEDLVVRAPIGCAPCLRRSCPGLEKLCMRLIRPEDVMLRIESALERAG